MGPYGPMLAHKRILLVRTVLRMYAYRNAILLCTQSLFIDHSRVGLDFISIDHRYLIQLARVILYNGPGGVNLCTNYPVVGFM